ncbi:unnamed protein product [Camellia sinensis]
MGDEINHGSRATNMKLFFLGSGNTQPCLGKKYYCDYCDTYLTHDSPSVRKQHNAGYKHKANVRTYYQQFEAQQNQSLIDQKIKEHLGQTTAYQQVGAAYNALRPRVPILPTPMMPMAGNTQLPVNSPLIPGPRPPVLPRPLPDWAGIGYMSAPVMPPMVGPPGAAPLPGQVTNLPRPPPMGAPSAVPGTTMTPASVSTSMVTPAMYQAANSAPPTSGGFDSFNMSAQAPEANQYRTIVRTRNITYCASPVFDFVILGHE